MSSDSSWHSVGLYLVWMALVLGLVMWGGPWLIAAVGPVLSNVVLGIPVLVLAVLQLRGQRREYRRLETQGDPQPLRPPFEYEPSAQGTRSFSWVIGGGFLLLTLTLAGAGNYSLLAPGLIVSLMLMALGQEDVRHARAMDARLREDTAKEA
ncbi:hypothetical protein [Kocuria rosea]|uniref:Uncharacterized protein n=1 Tax=Kocuria rosea TaxID=1275 RepID=A0A4R5YFL0_KOCRO|nr:hypothetical protein [Kocuria rosea]TDL43038.1 hypothetical protein E2R59_09460 [Kocuria rosea]